MNRVTLKGNLGKNLELRQTKSGKSVANTSLATQVTNQEGEKFTTWHRLTFWNKKAEVAQQQFQQGDFVEIKGSIRNDSWTDRDGVQRFSSYIVVGEINLIYRKGMQKKSAGEQQQQIELGAEDLGY